ncbi:MAG: ROK family protein [Ginsengibacter sp.]
MAVIAIDMGGTRIKFGIIGDGGNIISLSTLEATPNESIEKNLSSISQNITTLLSEKNISRSQLKAIGISVPGIVNDNNRVVSRYVKYTDANDFDFNVWAKNEWGLPIAVENDARAALIGEWKYGAGKGYNDIAQLTLGTGVGSAVLSEGRLYKGRHFLAGSLTGHISINYDGDPCNCGFFGCLETEASTWALPGIAARHVLFNKSSLSKIEKPEFIHLFEEADKGDELANILLQRCLKAWGTCVVNIVHSHDPELIIIGGGIMKQQSKILPFLQQMTDEYAWLPAGTIKIVAAQQIVYAGLLGMEYLAHSLIK